MANHCFSPSVTLLLVGIAAASLAACGDQSSATSTANSMQAGGAPLTDPTQVDADRVADIEQKERELAAREAELALKEREQELARREAALQASQSAPAKSPAPTPAKAPARTAPVAAAPAPAKAAPEAAPPILVPAGTELAIGLSADVSTKTAKVGDLVDGRLASDLMVDGRRAVAAGSPVRGSVTEVVSGSNKIGGVPTLAMSFDRVELEDGTAIAIRGHMLQQGKSETAKDTAKIVGGTAAGAIIGHQIDDDKGKIIGGLLGGAAGAVAAKKTGGEVEIPAGTVVVVAVDAPFEVNGG